MTTEPVRTSVPISRIKLLQLVTDELTKTEHVADDGLKLADLQLSSIPPELIELIRESVTKLSLQNNVLSVIPNYFNRLSNLRYLDLHGNRFTEFPQVLCALNRLEILDLSKNVIKRLPASFESLVNLKVLSLSDNKLETLPQSICELTNLKILELTENPLVQPPMSFVNELQAGNDDWIPKLRNYIAEHVRSGSDTGIERSRSNSWDHVSTKAAKRMGFIVNKKPPTTFAVKEDDSNGAQPQSHHIPNPTPVASMSAAVSAAPGPDQTKKIMHQHSLSQPDLARQTTSPPASSARMPAAQAQQAQAQLQANVRSRAQSLSARGESRSNSDLPSLMPPMQEIKEEADHQSSAYFKRLSTLSEVKKPKDVTIINVSRKMLYIFTQLHSNFDRITLFCAEKRVAAKMNSTLSSAKQSIDMFIEILEDVETSEGDSRAGLIDRLLHCIAISLTLYKQIMKCLQENLADFFDNIDICFTRSLYLNMFGSFMELFNASKILYPDLAVRDPKPVANSAENGFHHLYQVPNALMTHQELSGQAPPPPQQSAQQPSLRVDTSIAQAGQVVPGIQSAQQPPTQVSDERLLESVYNATSAAQIVFSQLTNAINKTAWSTVPESGAAQQESVPNEVVTAKVKDLTSICVSAIDSTKTLKGSLHVVSAAVPQQADKMKFYKDTNAFLKSIISILNTTKASINDLPILNELRPSLAALTKATKDVTILLENSTFKSVYVNQHQAAHSADDHTAAAQAPALHQAHLQQQQQLPQSAVTSHPPPLSSIPSMTAFPPFHQQASLNTQQQQLNNIAASLPPVTTPLIAALGSAQAQAVLPNASTSNLTSPLNNSQQPAQGQNPFDALFANSTTPNEDE